MGALSIPLCVHRGRRVEEKIWPDWGWSFLNFYLNSSWLTYSVILVSGVQYSDSTVLYITQCSSPSVLPNPHHLFNPSPHQSPLWSPSICSLVKSLFLGLSPSLFFPLCSFVLFLKFHKWVESYGICLSLTDFT